MKLVLAAGLSLLLAGSSAALAQYHDNHGVQLAQYGGRENDRDRDRDRDRNEVRGIPHWEKGDRLPPEYRGDRYVVEDWRAMHLRRPVRGYHWVHVGDRFLLVENRNGLIREWREAELRR